MSWTACCRWVTLEQSSPNSLLLLTAMDSEGNGVLDLGDVEIWAGASGLNYAGLGGSAQATGSQGPLGWDHMI